MSQWSNEDVLNFLECYQAEPCIWDPGNSDHKDKNKVVAAWNRLSKTLKKPVKELKTKKEILMVTFRKHLKKQHECISAGMEDIYEPTWFAYKLMESFLLPVYTAKLGLNLGTQSRSSETVIEEIVEETEETEHDYSMLDPSTSAATVSAPFTKKSPDKSHRRSASDLTEQQMAFSQITDFLNRRHSKPSKVDHEDECDLYAKLLAKKIRELPKDERQLMMYEIDGLFIQKIKQKSFLRETPSPQYYSPSRPSSASSGYILSNRPPHNQSLISEPHSKSHHDFLTTNETSDLEKDSTSLSSRKRRRTPRGTDNNKIIYSTEPNSSNLRPTVKLISNKRIIIPKQNIIHTEFLKEEDDNNKQYTSE